jgi:pimeloyl-ACP methyl ester carboxylesterase
VPVRIVWSRCAPSSGWCAATRTIAWRTAFAAYASGDHAGALAIFMSAVSGLEWTKARALLEQRVPGALEQTVRDADTFFGVELPALTEWTFGAKQAARLDRPVLSMLGSETQPVWVEVAEFLRSVLPQVDECTIDGAGHLLPIQRPELVARGMAEFLGRHSIGDDGRDPLERPSRSRGVSVAVSR